MQSVRMACISELGLTVADMMYNCNARTHFSEERLADFVAPRALPSVSGCAPSTQDSVAAAPRRFLDPSAILRRRPRRLLPPSPPDLPLPPAGRASLRSSSAPLPGFVVDTAMDPALLNWATVQMICPHDPSCRCRCSHSKTWEKPLLPVLLTLPPRRKTGYRNCVHHHPHLIPTW